MASEAKKKKKAEAASTGVKQKFTFFDVIIYVLIALLAIICLYPFLNVLAISLSGYNAVLSNSVFFIPKDVTVAAYQNGLVLTTAAAYALSRNYLPGRKVFSGLILFTMYFSGGIIPTFLVVKGVGMFDTLWALFVPQAVNVFNFVIMRSFFRELPIELEEAAQIDGANEMQTLFKIVLPLSVPIIATIGLFYAVQYWNDYFQALIYINDSSKYTLQLRLRSLLFDSVLNSDGANAEGIGTQVMTRSLKMASIMVSTIPILLVYPWLQKYFVKGVMLGSVKG